MIFIGLPALDCRLHAETVRCLLDERAAAHLLGIDIAVGVVPGCSNLPQARDELVRQFLASGADRLVFVDTDVSWELGALIKIALQTVDFVGGCYRYKEDRENYPVGWLPDRAELWADSDTGLIEVSHVPGGFMSLSRKVFGELRKAYPGREYACGGRDLYGYFQIPPGGGEDGKFCEEWRNIGGKVWLEPNIDFGHHDGGRAYRGNIGRWLWSRTSILGFSDSIIDLRMAG